MSDETATAAPLPVEERLFTLEEFLHRDPPLPPAHRYLLAHRAPVGPRRIADWVDVLQQLLAERI